MIDRPAMAGGPRREDQLGNASCHGLTGTGHRMRGLDPQRPIPVWRLAQRLREIVAGAVRPVWVEGEVVEPRRDARGHLRFTLRDAQGRIECVRWATGRNVAADELVNGAQAVVLVSPTVYARASSLAYVVTAIHESGEAEAKRKLDALRLMLEREGLFSDARKRPLPLLPRRIGVITSRGSAAWYDVASIARARHSGIPLVLVPAQMQGAGAAESIVSAIRRADVSHVFDVLLVTRGGGSADDLGVFDDERVARAVASCTTPVAVAVGHEIDVSITDRVADARAATPSAAAALVVPMRADLEAAVRCHTGAMGDALKHQLQRNRERLQIVRGNLARSALLRVVSAQRKLDRLRSALDRGGRRCATDRRATVSEQLALLNAAVRRRLVSAQAHQNTLNLQLAALSPNAILARGYAIARGASGEVLSAVGDFQAGSTFFLQLANGVVPVLVAGPNAISSQEDRS